MLLRRKKQGNTNRKGFTLAELLVVVAIIAILVAVSIPIFTGKLEETRETTDIANMRAAKAAAVEALLSEDYKTSWSYYGGQYTAVFDADKGVFVGDGSYEKAYGQGTEKDAGMTYAPNEAPYNKNDSSTEGKSYFVYDGSKSYKGFMIDAIIIEENKQIILRWFTHLPSE